MSDIRSQRLTIGISLGDYNGVGPEVILKSLQDNVLASQCTIIVYGSMRILNRWKHLLNMKDWSLFGTQRPEQANPKQTNVITCWTNPEEDVQPGQVTEKAGRGAYESLKKATEDLKAGKLDALVTAPINKNNIQNNDFKFVGHTEYLGEVFGIKEPLMFMVSERLRVGVVTDHIPLGEVSKKITKQQIINKLQAMNQSLKGDFGIQRPRIAVLGLNPHAGENGLLGKEEQEIIEPAIKELKQKNLLAYGPFSADGFFATQMYQKYDAVLAMYHDQGLIPFKAIAFDEGVNFTAGLPVVRTSPDHGTAYDIAGKDQANPSSMLQAIYTAIDIARNRKDAADIEKNALKKNPAVEKLTKEEEK